MHAVIIPVQLNHIIGIAGLRITGQVNIELYASQHVHPEILNTIAVELYGKRKGYNSGLYAFGKEFSLTGQVVQQVIFKVAVQAQH